MKMFVSFQQAAGNRIQLLNPQVAATLVLSLIDLLCYFVHTRVKIKPELSKNQLNFSKRNPTNLFFSEFGKDIFSQYHCSKQTLPFFFKIFEQFCWQFCRVDSSALLNFIVTDISMCCFHRLVISSLLFSTLFISGLEFSINYGFIHGYYRQIF